jgi:hypothetical protein
MKKILFTLGLLVSFSSYGQIVVKNKLYKVVYSEFYQQPISLENNKEIYVREVYTFPNDASVKGKDIENYKVKLLSI